MLTADDRCGTSELKRQLLGRLVFDSCFCTSDSAGCWYAGGMGGSERFEMLGKVWTLFKIVLFFNDETISYPVYYSYATDNWRCLQLPTRVSFVSR